MTVQTANIAENVASKAQNLREIHFWKNVLDIVMQRAHKHGYTQSMPKTFTSVKEILEKLKLVLKSNTPPNDNHVPSTQEILRQITEEK